jgi:hypothetical protein
MEDVRISGQPVTPDAHHTGGRGNLLTLDDEHFDWQPFKIYQRLAESLGTALSLPQDHTSWSSPSWLNRSGTAR